MEHLAEAIQGYRAVADLEHNLRVLGPCAAVPAAPRRAAATAAAAAAPPAGAAPAALLVAGATELRGIDAWLGVRVRGLELGSGVRSEGWGLGVQGWRFGVITR